MDSETTQISVGSLGVRLCDIVSALSSCHIIAIDAVFCQFWSCMIDDIIVYVMTSFAHHLLFLSVDCVIVMHIDAMGMDVVFA